MKYLLALIMSLWVSVSHAREISQFINITESGVYDFKNEVLTVKPYSHTPAIVIGEAENIRPAFEVKDVTIRNLTILGSKNTQLSEYYARLPYLRNNGITIRGAKNVTIENVTIIGARSGGIVLEQGSSAVVVRNSRIIASHYDGIAVCESRDALFENLEIAYNEYAGISLDLHASELIFSKICSHHNKDWTAFQRACTDVIYNQITSENNGGGLYLSLNEYIKGNRYADGVVVNSTFKDARPSYIESCCKLLTPVDYFPSWRKTYELHAIPN